MRNLYPGIILIIISISAVAQNKHFTIHSIALPPEISYYDNQFSGLQINNGKLYLMPECRLQNNHEARLYSIYLSDIDQHLKDKTYLLPFEKIRIHGLDSLAAKIKAAQQDYEGLEAFVIDYPIVYFSVETSTPSSYCYLLKGRLVNNDVYLEQTLLPIQKPRLPDGSIVYNAGFEAIALIRNRIHEFYEYNYFNKSYVYSYDRSFNITSKDSLPIDKVPFRITDITKTMGNHFTAINYFYNGEGADTVYRVAPTDRNNSLIKAGNSYQNYCRLIDIKYSRKHFSWKPTWIFPGEYAYYNWEGIAAYKKGYFIINDKYTPARPYSSVLLYVR
jgi:hypothetical protein